MCYRKGQTTGALQYIRQSSKLSPGRTQSCPLVVTWPEGRGSADPCGPRRPRQKQAPSHSYPAEGKETNTESENEILDVMDDSCCRLKDAPTLPEACPRQEGVRWGSQAQVTSAASSDDNTKTRRDGTGRGRVHDEDAGPGEREERKSINTTKTETLSETFVVCDQTSGVNIL